jgi:hypothetical protein
MMPQFEPLRPEIANPKNQLANGSGIPIGLTEE